MKIKIFLYIFLISFFLNKSLHSEEILFDSDNLKIKEEAKIQYIPNPYLDRYQFKTLAPWDETNILNISKLKPLNLEKGINKYLNKINE